jgi:hypothetical protein
MLAMTAWSHSALNKFETCPRQYYLLRVSKQAKDVKGEAALWGDTVHKHLEARAKDGAPLPSYLDYLDPIVGRILATPGEKIIEHKITITQGYTATSWFAKDAWCRSIVDLGVVGETSATLLDWKTGKRKPDSDQMALFAGMALAAYPYIEVVHTGFVWTKDRKVDRDRFTRSDAPAIWREFLPRVARLEHAFATNAWPANPSGLCRKYCPVGKALCSYCGE